MKILVKSYYHCDNSIHTRGASRYQRSYRDKLVIDIIYYYIIWTDNRGTVPEANTRRPERIYPMIKVLWGCVLKLSLYLVNSALILYRTGNMQPAILLSFVIFSSLPPCGLQSTHPPMLYYVSPYVVYNVYGYDLLRSNVYDFNVQHRKTYHFAVLPESQHKNSQWTVRQTFVTELVARLRLLQRVRLAYLRCNLQNMTSLVCHCTVCTHTQYAPVRYGWLY